MPGDIPAVRFRAACDLDDTALRFHSPGSKHFECG